MNKWLWNDHTYIVQSSEFTLPQTIHVRRQGIIACNNNNMRNPTKWNVGHFAICTHEFFHLWGSVNSELRTIYVSSVWSHHNQLFTMHHSGYYNLVSLIFGTTIPTSFNILIKCFLHFIYMDPQWCLCAICCTSYRPLGLPACYTQI